MRLRGLVARHHDTVRHRNAGAALVLARAGRHVVVVDAGAPGFGASTRNGGQVGSGNQKFAVKTLIAMHGERKAVELLHEGVEMLDGIENLIREEKIDCSFTRCGRFRGAMRPLHYEAMARDMDDLKRYAGVQSAMISRREQNFMADRCCQWMRVCIRESITRVF